MTYANLIKDYNESVHLKDINVVPCAYLHNYYFEEDYTLLSNNYKEYTDKAALFGHNDVIKLRNFIKKYIEDGDGGNILYEIDHGRIRPSKMLQNSLRNMLKGNKEFYMIDNQKIVYEYALRNTIDTVSANNKNVMIVRGGPGTGKSVLKVNLLVELNNRNMTCFYVTKNATPRSVYYSKLRWDYTQTYINHLFQNKGENQIKEIINAAKFSIFFIDENQKVTLKDIGSEDLIKKFAVEQGAGIYTFDLDSQFRCNGSDEYIAWLDRVLDIKDTANFDIDGFDYDFIVLDDPNEVRRLIEEKNKINNKSRMVAGYC